MSKIFMVFLSFLVYLLWVDTAYAIVDPFSTLNNKFGIHILFPSELEQAARLVNSNGGDFGYVTIPIQATDRNAEKWQKFMDDAKKLHIIPIIRIASENYYFDTAVWRKPQYEDILDFANFLNSLDWPTINKYIIVFNEVNRSDEWQGNTSPEEYAQILSYTIEAFKVLNENFFIISAGLDNASSNIHGTSINQYDFMSAMDKEVPGIFGRIDGMASHSYPNPGFRVPPWVETSKSISSFKFERGLALQLGGRPLPVFITETGWSKEAVSESLIGGYIKRAFEEVWSDSNIVAVTPFILQASGPYAQFSLINEDGSYSQTYLALQNFPKVKGEPVLEAEKEVAINSSKSEKIKAKTFKNKSQYDESIAVSIDKAKIATDFLKWFFKSLNVL